MEKTLSMGQSVGKAPLLARTDREPVKGAHERDRKAQVRNLDFG